MLEVQGLSESEVTMGNSVTIGRNVKIRPSSYYGIGPDYVIQLD